MSRMSSLVPPTNDTNNHIECCICQSKDDEHSLGLVIRLVDTGGNLLSCRNIYICQFSCSYRIVLGVREANGSFANNRTSTADISNPDQSSSKDLLTCCPRQSKFTDNQQLSSNNKSKTLRSIYTKSPDRHAWTCAQFYEERIRSLLEIFSEVLQHLFFSFYPTTSNLEKCFPIHHYQLANWYNSQFLWTLHSFIMLSTISQISYGEKILFIVYRKSRFFLEKNLFRN